MEKRYFAYCRESVKGLDSAIEIQKEQIEKYSTVYNISIVGWYIDNGISAYKVRPKFDKMMKDVDQVGGIICADLTRFGRNTMELLYNTNVLKEKGKDLVFIREHWDTSSKEGKMFLTFMAAIADYERSKINERMTAGREWAKSHGTKSGKPLHRPSVTIDWSKYDDLHNKGLSISSISKVIGVSKSKLYASVRKRKT
jgi:DNA invertase Pin-like site-specific DNA recombinase